MILGGRGRVRKAPRWGLLAALNALMSIDGVVLSVPAGTQRLEEADAARRRRPAQQARRRALESRGRLACGPRVLQVTRDSRPVGTLARLLVLRLLLPFVRLRRWATAILISGLETTHPVFIDPPRLPRLPGPGSIETFKRLSSL